MITLNKGKLDFLTLVLAWNYKQNVGDDEREEKAVGIQTPQKQYTFKLDKHEDVYMGARKYVINCFETMDELAWKLFVQALINNSADVIANTFADEALTSSELVAIANEKASISR